MNSPSKKKLEGDVKHNRVTIPTPHTILRLLNLMILAAFVLVAGGCAISQAHVELREVFRAGEPNSHGFAVNSYRIPGFVATDNGTLVVLAEARKYSCGDKTPHDLVAKRSTDGGITWGPIQMVVEPGAVWGPAEGGPNGGAVYDPTPVLAADNTIRVIFSYVPTHTSVSCPAGVYSFITCSHGEITLSQRHCNTSPPNPASVPITQLPAPLENNCTYLCC